jgi:1,4-dihydroxy-2-naphthoyl-CoA synthase
MEGGKAGITDVSGGSRLASVIGSRVAKELFFCIRRQTHTMKTLAAIAVLLLTIAPAHAQTTNVTGKWTGTMTRTAPDGRSQTIDFMFDLTQKGKVLTGTAGPNAERQWAIEKGGAVDGSKVTFKVQQPDGPLRTFTLALVEGRLKGDMLAELKGQTFTTKVDVGRANAK